MLRTLRNTRRLLHAARVLAQHDALVPREYLAGMPFSVRVMRRILGTRDATDTEALSAGIRLARALESLGPAYIKLGQVLATRPDLIGDDVALALESLQDRLPPFPTDVAKAQVELALRKPVTEMFEAFGDAVAAASIAQVHEARTTGEGRRVAVKILRPGVEQQFAEDLSAFAFAALVAERFSAEARRLRVVTVIDRLTTSVALELDLRMEAAAASELRENTRADEDFRVPEVDWDRTGERVMTAEWIDGITVRDPAAIAAAGHDPRRLAIVVIRTFLTHALRDGFFHADMHQGNLFVDVEGRLVAVDFGIMGRLSPEMRRFLAETLNGFLNRDYLRVAQVHYDFGFVPRTHPIATFAQALRAIGEPIFGRTARDMSMGRLLQQLFDTTRRFDMAVQPQLLLMQKTMMVAEGVARTLDPEFDIWAASRPVVERWMVQSVGPEARLRDAAEGLEALSRAAQHLPRLVRDAEAVSQMLAEGGLRLHPDTMRHFADVQIRRAKHIRVAIWIAAAALAVLAFVLVLRP